jgi:hypothetical protein
MSLNNSLAILCIAILIGTNTLAQDKQQPPVKAKEPTVVTVRDKQAEVATAESEKDSELKKRSMPVRIGSSIVKGIGHAFNAVFDWTEDSLGVGDDVDPKKPKHKEKIKEKD